MWASPKSSRDGMGTTTSRATCPAAVLASLPVPAERPERREPSLCTLPASLGDRPPPVPTGRSPPVPSGRLAVLLGQSGPRVVLALGVVPNIRRPREERDLQMWGSVKAQIEKGGVDMRQCNQRNKLDGIHGNSYEIGTNFVRISHFQNIQTNLFT